MYRSGSEFDILLYIDPWLSRQSDTHLYKQAEEDHMI